MYLHAKTRKAHQRRNFLFCFKNRSPPLACLLSFLPKIQKFISTELALKPFSSFFDDFFRNYRPVFSLSLSRVRKTFRRGQVSPALLGACIWGTELNVNDLLFLIFAVLEIRDARRYTSH